MAASNGITKQRLRDRLVGAAVALVVAVVAGLFLYLAAPIGEWSKKAAEGDLTLPFSYAISEQHWTLSEEGDSVALGRLWKDLVYACTLYGSVEVVHRSDVARIIGNIARFRRTYLLQNPNAVPLNDIYINVLSSIDTETKISYSSPDITVRYEPRYVQGWAAGRLVVDKLPVGRTIFVSLDTEISPAFYDQIPDSIAFQTPEASASEVLPRNVTMHPVTVLEAEIAARKLSTGASRIRGLSMPHRSAVLKPGAMSSTRIVEGGGFGSTTPGTCDFVNLPVPARPAVRDVTPRNQ